MAYLLVDQERYANAPPGPLARFVAGSPGRVRKVWGGEADGSSVAIYEVKRRRSRAEGDSRLGSVSLAQLGRKRVKGTSEGASVGSDEWHAEVPQSPVGKGFAISIRRAIRRSC